MAIIFTWLWLVIVGFRALPLNDWPPSAQVGPEQSFPSRETPSWALDLKPKVQTPVYSALLSGLYPGLGQLYNGALWRGVLFIIFFTTALTATCRLFMNCYWQHTEVPAALVVLLASGLVSIWALAIMDAYTDIPPEQQA